MCTKETNSSHDAGQRMFIQPGARHSLVGITDSREPFSKLGHLPEEVIAEREAVFTEKYVNDPLRFRKVRYAFLKAISIA